MGKRINWEERRAAIGVELDDLGAKLLVLHEMVANIAPDERTDAEELAATLGELDVRIAEMVEQFEAMPSPAVDVVSESTEQPPVAVEDRRNLLALMASDPGEVIRFLAECGEDALPAILHCICLELCHVSLHYEEDIPPVKEAVQFIGGMVGGLMFGEGHVPDPDRDPEDRVSLLHDAACTQGARIMAGAGVAPFVKR